MRIHKLQSLIKTLGKEYTLKDSRVVIDGKSYFQNLYKESGCHYVLGGEYDRFGDYLKKHLSIFEESNVSCFVIFKGAMQRDIKERLELHQKVVDQADSLTPEENTWNEPIFLKDLVKQILDEFGIKYAVFEYDDLFELVNTAKYYNCPVITKNFEYTFFGVGCITPKSLSFDPKTKSISAKFYNCLDCRPQIALQLDQVAVYIVLMDEIGNYLQSLEQLIGYTQRNAVYITRRWVRRQKISVILSDISKNMDREKHQKFLQEYHYVKSLVLNKVTKEKASAVNYFNDHVTKEHVNWFRKGLLDGRIGIPYVNLKNDDLFSGSWLVFDGDKEDAMIASMEIVRFAHGLLTDFQRSTITFIGRVGKKSVRQEYITNKNFTGVSRTPSKYFKDDWKNIPDYFRCFLETSLPGFDLNMLNKASEDCRLLIISLVFYVCKVNMDFLPGVYSILLSYVMLGHVTKVTGLLKRSNFELLNYNDSGKSEDVGNEISKGDGLAAANALISLFYREDTTKFDRKILHMFSEFQHCLQQMNFLNRLCGQKYKCTIYHETYNATFIYNMFFTLNGKGNPLNVIENNYLKRSTSVLNYYKNLVDIFDNILASVLV